MCNGFQPGDGLTGLLDALVGAAPNLRSVNLSGNFVCRSAAGSLTPAEAALLRLVQKQGLKEVNLSRVALSFACLSALCGGLDEPRPDLELNLQEATVTQTTFNDEERVVGLGAGRWKASPGSVNLASVHGLLETSTQLIADMLLNSP